MEKPFFNLKNSTTTKGTLSSLRVVVVLAGRQERPESFCPHKRSSFRTKSKHKATYGYTGNGNRVRAIKETIKLDFWSVLCHYEELVTS